MTRNTDLKDFALLRDHCDKTSRITESVIDDFLVAFAAKHHVLEKKMDQSLSRFRQLLSKFDRSDVDLFKSQYIIHEVFKKGGLIEKFLRNPVLNRFSGEERIYLEQQVAVPWRFSFSEILNEPARDFYIMKDVFSGEEYLLFSPSIVRIKATGQMLLWFNLIGFNGSCWQSYGPIGAYQSFGPEEIFFFATEKNPYIEDESEVQTDIENDPLPYMMLLSGAAYPRTFHKEDEMIIMMAEHESETLDTVRLKKQFISEYSNGVYRFTHKSIGEHPHFAQVYYDENKKLLLFYTLTEAGFKNLIKDFNTFGHRIPDKAYLRIRPQIVTAARLILKKKIILNEYEDFFHKDTDPVVASNIKKMNEFTAIVLPFLNEGLDPDIEEAALKTGLSVETASDLVKIIREQITKVGGKVPPKKVTREPTIQKTGKSRKAEQDSDTLRMIYMAAKLICELEPWKNLYETEIFGVKMPESGLTWFISVMGISGEFTGIAAYKDYHGLFGFHSLQKETETVLRTTLFTIPHLLLSLTDRENLDKKDLEAIKKSGVAFRGKGLWPKLEEVVPGFVPTFPGKEVLEDLRILLDQAASVLLSARKNPDFLYKEGDKGDEILIRIPSGNPGKLNWKDHYEIPDPARANVKYKIAYDKNSSEAVSKLKVSKVTLQIDLVLVPTPVKEPGKRGYFPFMLLLVDKQSGMIPGMKLLQPDPDLPALYESFTQKLLEEIIKLGYRPVKMEFRSDLLFGLAKNALTQSGCKPVLVKHMARMVEAIESLFDSLMK